MAEPSILRTAFKGQCPQCGAQTVFETPAQLAMKCSSCGLAFAELEGGGRFAGMFTAIIAMLLILIATVVDIAVQPPFWLQVVFWAPATIVVVLGSLRLFKTIPMLANYQRRYGDKDEAE